MIYLNNTIAQYQLNAAAYYYKRGAYVAAINRAEDILMQFPTTPQNEQALAIIMQSEQQLGLNDLASSTASVLKYNYPHDPALQAQSQS